MSTTPHSFRKHLLVGLVGLIVLTGITPNALAQCQLQKLLAADGATSTGSTIACTNAAAPFAG